MSQKVPLTKLVLVPAVVTLAVTLLRLAGELLHWSPALFSPAAGGGGALVGISWLVFLFGPLFAFQLARAGAGPASTRAAILYPLLAVALVPLTGIVTQVAGLSQESFATFGIFVVVSLVGIAVAWRGWSALCRTLLAYGLAARVPVVVVMLFAILGNWGTHYDVPPSASFPAMSPLSKWLLIGVLPQLTFWIYYTVALGALVGAVVWALDGRVRSPRV